MYRYKAKVINIVDGDTVDCSVDLGFQTIVTKRFRIKDYDAPETWRPSNDKERIHGEKATEVAAELLFGKEITLESSKYPGIYNRYLAKITLPDGRNFATVMKEKGLEKQERY